MDNKFEAAIFDMDGLLIDSMIHWIESDAKFFGAFGITLTNDIIKKLTGGSEQQNLNWIRKEFKLKESLEDLLAHKRSVTQDIYKKDTQPMPGANALLKSIKSKKYAKQALASGANAKEINLVVDRFGWRDLFDAMVSSDHVNFVGKPDPAIFRYTADKLGVAAEKCIVFEDAENGVTAAKRAGMRCIAVPDKRWSFGDFSAADLVVSSLEDERVFNFIGLPRE